MKTAEKTRSPVMRGLGLSEMGREPVRVHPEGFEPSTFGSVDRSQSNVMSNLHKSLRLPSSFRSSRGSSSKYADALPYTMLAQVIKAWPMLPDPIRSAILALVKSADS